MRCWCMPGKALSVNLSKLLNERSDARNAAGGGAGLLMCAGDAERSR